MTARITPLRHKRKSGWIGGKDPAKLRLSELVCPNHLMACSCQHKANRHSEPPEFYPLPKNSREDFPGAQWLRIRLPMQGTRVRALVCKDPTGRRATKPVRHDYRACALEPASHNY